jgi:hypothetical protein
MIQRHQPKQQKRSDGEYIGFKGVDCVVLSMENKKIKWGEIEKFRGYKDVHVLVLLRNPVGNFASMWKVYSRRKCTKMFPTWGKLWHHYAGTIDENHQGSVPFTPVLYENIAGVSKEEHICRLLQQIGIHQPNLKDTKSILYQRSSFKNTKNTRRTGDTLETCPFTKNQPFRNLMDPMIVEFTETWDRIIQDRT